MKEFMKNNKVTIIVVVATVVLAAVAIFTAMRLYQLRDEAVAPNAPEQAGAWVCSEYKFRVGQNGEVFARNGSGQNEPQQNAKVYIDSVEVATLQVPALGKNTAEVSIGTVTVPGSSFVWEVIGSKDCSDSGSYDANTCSLSFTISSETGTPSPTPSDSPTPTPSGSSTPTSTPSDTPTSTPTDTPSTSSTPSSSNPPSLPDAGNGLPTIVGMGIGALLLLGAVLLAL